MRFYLGTHKPYWLAHPVIREANVPLFVSRNTIAGEAGVRITDRRRLPVAGVRWALDSGGFSELSRHGRWTITPEEYIAEVYRCRDEMGWLDWAAPQDWMTEDHILAMTGLTVSRHQRHTVDNLLRLRGLAPDLPFVPVIQGQTLADYERCVRMYGYAGIDLAAEPLVGIGSVCRRQATNEIETIVTALAGHGLRLHGFGVKIQGLARYGAHLTSSDSMAWSYGGRRVQPGCTPTHKNEANCMRYALEWHAKVRAVLP